MTTVLVTLLFIITLHDGFQLINAAYIPLIIIAFIIDKNNSGEDFYTGY
jgi:hypothetical protein